MAGEADEPHGDWRLAAMLQEACLERELTVAVAESCTGGLVAAEITAIPGSSGYFLGGVVAYSNDAKEAFLGVPHDLLAAHGAVSREVAEAMAAGARARFGADLAVSITGIAGPDGGSVDKPVGTVYLGYATPRDAGSRYKRCSGDRAAIRAAAARTALDFLFALAVEHTA